MRNMRKRLGKSMIEIELRNNQSEVEISEEIIELAKIAINKIIEIEHIENNGEISLLIVDSEEIKSINKEYRGKDEVTDVLSFPQYENLLDKIDESEYLVIGDIVICAKRAMEQAMQYSHGIEREFIYLVVHSMYHLLGFDHMSEEDKEMMREKEKNALHALNINRGNK